MTAILTSDFGVLDVLAVLYGLIYICFTCGSFLQVGSAIKII